MPPLTQRRAILAVVLVFTFAFSARPDGGQVADAPVDRHHHAMTFDPGINRVVIFGGTRLDDERKTQILGDFWAWNGREWSAIARETTEPASGHRLYAGTSGVTFVGGRRGIVAEWRHGAWDRIGAAPHSGAAAAAAFDSDRDRFVMFGGAPAPGAAAADTWEFDGRRWHLASRSGPGGLSGAAMAYDEARRGVVLFGGRDANRAVSGDTWTWDGRAWTRVASAGPPARYGHAMAYDSHRRQVVLYGGSTVPRSLLSDTWTWNGRAWTRADAPGPPARTGAEMAFDRARGVLLLFGGAGDDPVHATFGDTWE